MNKHSEQRLGQVHRLLAQRVRVLVERLAAQGITVEIVQGMRSHAEQDALFAQGRNKPGKVVTKARGGFSMHNFGLAVDLCPFENGKPHWQASPAVWQQIGQEAEKLGLEWGGNWKFVDKPHVQLSAMSLAQCRALYKQGGLRLVWQRVSAAVEVVEAPPVVTAKPPATPSAISPSGSTAGKTAVAGSSDKAPFPVAWSDTPHAFVGSRDRWCEVCNWPDRHPIHKLEPVTAPELRPVTASAPAQPGADSRKSQQTVLAATLAQIWASVLAWWQGLDVGWIYAGLMIGLTILALAYLHRQVRMGEARARKQ